MLHDLMKMMLAARMMLHDLIKMVLVMNDVV